MWLLLFQMYNTNWQYNIACITAVPTGFWWVSNLAFWFPNSFCLFCLWIPHSLKMYFLFMFKAKPPCSSWLTERFFLPFDSITEDARPVLKISSCNSSHQSLLIPRATCAWGISVWWGQVPESQRLSTLGQLFWREQKSPWAPYLNLHTKHIGWP